MSLLKKAMEQASSPEDLAAAQTVAVLMQPAQEAGQPDYFSTDPTSGYDAAQVAVRLFESRRLEPFSDFLKERNLSPNIVLANGLTLLQNSLFRFPQDVDRIECLLSLGANPNLFMRKIDEEAFGNKVHPATFHPLNYAFANWPQTTSSEICLILRKYGASAEGLRNYLEVDPLPTEPEDKEKGEFRKKLIAIQPDPERTSIVRKDVDLSVMQKHLANVETQLAAAGFQVVTYLPPQKPVAKPRTDAMVPLPSDYEVLPLAVAKQTWQSASSGGEAARLLKYPGQVPWKEGSNLLSNDTGRLKQFIAVDFSSSDQGQLFAWAQPGIGNVSSSQGQTVAKV